MRRGRGGIGLIGQIIAVLLVAVTAEFTLSAVLYERASEFSLRDDEARRLSEHLLIARRLIGETPPASRAAMARSLSTDHYATGWAPDPPAMGEPRLAATARQITAWEPALALADLRLRRSAAAFGARIEGGLRIADRSWLTFRIRRPITADRWTYARILGAALVALLVIAAASMAVRRTLAPLRRLAVAADRIGTGSPRKLAEAGPHELRQVTAAFNRMQERIARLIADRTQALAAVGHDLRTPLARLRLRVDTLADAQARATIGRDVAEMQAMVGSLLAYLGGEGDPEAPALTDIAVLCATLADEATDAGHHVRYHGPDHCERALRRLNLKRALANLVENACHYGAQVTITLEPREQALTLAVEDDGPGIPEEALSSVIEPFVRLDDARRRDTQGLGLGLAIVARAVAIEGGGLRLSNRATGGLRAEITLQR